MPKRPLTVALIIALGLAVSPLNAENGALIKRHRYRIRAAGAVPGNKLAMVPALANCPAPDPNEDPGPRPGGHGCQASPRAMAAAAPIVAFLRGLETGRNGAKRSTP